MHHRYLIVSLILLLFTSVSAVSDESNKQNVLSENEKQQGWQLLFDGKTLNGWHVYQHPNTPPAWVVNDGILTLDLKASGVQHGDLATNNVYQNFELAFDWQSPQDGNSGVFINVQEDDINTIAWHTGPEYQLLGTAHADNADITKQTGTIFGFSSPFTSSSVRPQGQWNHSVIKQINGNVEFYLNGQLTTQVDFTSEQWKATLSESRFKDYSGFSAFTQGHIVLQEWTSVVYFRNMKIREL